MSRTQSDPSPAIHRADYLTEHHMRVIDRLLNTDCFLDVTFTFKQKHRQQKQAQSTVPSNNAANKKMIRGNKFLLAAQSPVFERMFFGEMAQSAHRKSSSSARSDKGSGKDETIQIVDAEYDDFMTLILFMYSGVLRMESVVQGLRLLDLGEKYDVKHLLETLDRYFLEIFHKCTFEEAFLIYDSALTYNRSSLKGEIQDWFKFNAKNRSNQSLFPEDREDAEYRERRRQEDENRSLDLESPEWEYNPDIVNLD